MWEEMLSWAQCAPAPAAVRTECPEKPPRGDLVILPCMWAEGEFSSLSGQAYRPRGPWSWAWRKEQEGGLGLHGGKLLQALGLGLKRPVKEGGKSKVWGRGRDGGCSPDTIQ